ncbi:hypothetical protein OH797_38085 (plasmid) [Streptomyces anulatus]|uniref:hypothetical protein n=1 Tax=Streptomyces TaxID=1883 RepID=UPI001F1E8227|nr:MULTISPECIES: hypothetical protein [Streptomyces]WSC66686.1 hypothetical protein OHA57_38525 [Streptomyces anulatus]WTC68542.1 hypothetical protein OG865_38870 [Streptomyces anulatus]WTC76538.1 hypothetical protein OG882_39970 [Streptomyces anulatus]
MTADLAKADETFDRVCNDVRRADLRTADLTHLYLGGLRWDTTTQWPRHGATGSEQPRTR